jgi:hypothetical protein
MNSGECQGVDAGKRLEMHSRPFTSEQSSRALHARKGMVLALPDGGRPRRFAATLLSLPRKPRVFGSLSRPQRLTNRNFGGPVESPWRFARVVFLDKVPFFPIEPLSAME